MKSYVSMHDPRDYPTLTAVSLDSTGVPTLQVPEVTSPPIEPIECWPSTGIYIVAYSPLWLSVGETYRKCKQP